MKKKKKKKKLQVINFVIIKQKLNICKVFNLTYLVFLIPFSIQFYFKGLKVRLCSQLYRTEVV